MKVEILFLGTSALLHHNPQMVDPEFEISRQIKALTGKRKKTSEDLRQIEELEWHGGLYTGEVGGRMCVTQPCSKVRKCLINCGKITKMGKNVERSLIMTQLNAELIYQGSDKVKDFETEIKRLFKSREFSSRLAVGIGQKRVMRVRPQFYPWALIVPAVFIEDAGLNFHELQEIVSLAGQAERIGDNRVNGYGAFRGHVRELSVSSEHVGNTILDVREYFDSLDEEEEAA